MRCASNIATASIITDLVKGKAGRGQEHHLETGFGGARRAAPYQSPLLGPGGGGAAVGNRELGGETLVEKKTTTHQFARAMKEDIVEKVASLWDVKAVDAKFSE
jgi:hypothetical protein